MTPEQEVAKRKQLVSAARSLLSLQAGFGVGCTRINRVLYWLGREHQSAFPVFGEFLQATLNYPIGHERLMWDHEALLEKDRGLALIESEFRGAILKSCSQIIAMYS